MYENMQELIGFLAASLTTTSFFPQVYKTLSTRSTHDLSWGWITMMTGGVVAWLIYGLIRFSLPLILANGITFFALFLLLLAKIRYELFKPKS